MAADLKTSLIVPLLFVSLSACSSVPKSSTLTTGIDKTQLAQNASGTLRSQSDPICIQFYDNVETYIAAANKPNSGGKFLTSLGLGMAASIATAGIIPAGMGRVGQAAASTAVSSTVRQGGGLVLQGIKPSSATGTKISEAAAEIGCPLQLAP